jgi:hypothetical protein
MQSNFKRRSARMSKALGDDAYLESAGAIQTGVGGARSKKQGKRCQGD